MTVCARCGSTRKFIPEECPSCHFRPETLRELATAALLTTRFADDSLGTPQAALEIIASDIRAGKAPVLDEADLVRHEEKVKAFLSVKPRHIVWGLLLTFRREILFLVGLLVLWLALRAVFR